MSYQPHYIASFEDESGLNTYYEPFLLPEKAFPTLEDAFAWRGRIKRRLGFNTIGRLRRSRTGVVMPLSGASPFAFNLFTLVQQATEPQREVQTAPIGTAISNRLTIHIAGVNYVDQGDGTLQNSVTLDVLSTINYLTGSIVLVHAAGAGVAITADFAYYPGLPVMGLPDDITDVINEENLRAFDTKYAYQFVLGEFNQLTEIAPANTTWNGSDSDFFWTQTYWPMTPGTTKLMWTTNFNINGATRDSLRYYDLSTTTWYTFNPLITAAEKVYTCRCIVPYKNRLLMFNTLEDVTPNATIAVATHFPQRLRFSQIGNPLVQATGALLFDATAWRSDTPGKGGFIDVPSDQEIISVEFIKDVLIVKLERSSWKVIYTGNETLPFVFEKINTELGAESTFSLVPFDRGVFSVGNVGILTDDSVNVQRIDQKIPNFVFQFRNADNGTKRIHGIRNFTDEVVYWNYPYAGTGLKFPNKMLVYNYINQTYAIFNESFTCFGYFQQPNDVTWAQCIDITWTQFNRTWNSGALQAFYPDIVAGNQHGFVLLLNQKTFNSPAFAINGITSKAVTNQALIYSVNHNLQTGQFVKLTGILGSGVPDPSGLNDQIYRVIVDDIDHYTLEELDLITGQFFDVILLPGGTYLGMGRATVLNNINITTKVFAPFYEDGGQVRVGYLDFLFDITEDGQLMCDYYMNESINTGISISNPGVTVSGGVPASGILGSNKILTTPENNILLPFQQNQSKIWHRMFIQSIAQNFQLEFSLSDIQMVDEMINSSDIVLHAMTIYLSKNARLTP